MFRTAEEIRDLDSNRLKETEEFLVDYIKSVAGDNVDIGPNSILHKLLISPTSIFARMQESDAETLLNSNSLYQALTTPNIVDEETLDRLLSNYFIERNNSTPSSGKIRIILTELRYTPLPNNMVYTSNGINFRAIQSYNGVVSENDQVTDSDILITPYKDNKYSFVIDAVAEDEGSAGNIDKDVIMSFSTQQPHIESAITASRFEGGQDTETNAELIDRAIVSISNKGMSNRINTESLIKENFPNAKSISVLSSQDKELKRGSTYPFGIRPNNYVDIYAKTRDSLSETTINKTFTLQSDGETWLTTFTRNEYSVLFRVSEVLNEEDGKLLSNIDLERHTDLSLFDNIDVTPDIDNVNILSPYSYSTLTCKRDNEDSSIGDVKTFAVTIKYMPEISQIYSYVMSRPNQPLSGDVLVRPANICEVSVSIRILQGEEDVITEDDVLLIKQEIVKEINSIGFSSGMIPYTMIAGIVHKTIPFTSQLHSPVSLYGKIVSGYDDILVNNENGLNLVIPTIYDKEISNRTTCFSTNLSLIDVDVLEYSSLEV